MMQRVGTLLWILGALGCGGGTSSQSTTKKIVAPSPLKKEASPSVVRVWQKTPQKVAEFTKLCTAGVQRARALLPKLSVKPGLRTLENTLVPYNQIVQSVEASAAVASLMRSVHPSESFRQAAAVCEQETEKFISALKRNHQIYQAFADIDASTLDDKARRLVEHTQRDFRRAGVDKDEATRKRLEAIDEKLVSLGQKFAKNIADDVRYVMVAPSDLAGLPEDFKASHRPGKEGKVKITTNYPDYIPFMAYAESGKARKALYIEQKSRGGKKNESLLKEILLLRYEKAQLLGFRDWTDYITEDKMMKSGERAAQFIKRVVEIAKDRAKNDYAALLSQKKKTRARAKQVHDWEKTYYENKVKLERYGFDPQSVRPYFPYTQVKEGLLAITSAIYNVQYQPVQNPPIWHQDVEAYEVVRKDKMLGRIYLDMHPRASKYKHAAQFTLQSGIRGVQLPEGVLVCNFPNPRTSGGKALMEHSDVVTMFHEFGHLMHHVLGGQQEWLEQSGVATEWDFVEAPSQMFEEWAWDYQTLALFAKHHQSGEVLGKDLVERMRKADKFGLGTQVAQQMFYAAISLNFHTGNPTKLDMLSAVKALQSEYTPFPYVEGTRFHANFGHLNGYSAMYYTYMWSLVIAKDLLTPFKKHGLMNTEWTHKYRDIILGQGGSKDAAVLIKEFLGREFSFAAFEEYLQN